MPKTKKKKSFQTRKKDNLLFFIRRRFFFLSALVVAALLFSGQISFTQDYRSGKSVLGEENTETNGTGLSTANQGGRNESATAQTNVTSGTVPSNLRFNFEVDKGKTTLKVEDNEGRSVSTQESVRSELEKEIEAKGVEVSSAGGELTFTRNNTQAVSHFPLSVDPETHELTVTTPAGTKTVTVLPDAAVNNFLEHAKVATTASPSSTAGAGGFGSLSAPSGTTVTSVDLNLRNNDLVYEVQAQKEEKFLGFIPVTTTSSTAVSAQNGQIVSKTQSLLNRFISLLSF